LATIDMGRKVGAALPLSGGLGPHITMWPGQRPTFVPSDILIHPGVWPQQTWAANWGLLCPFFEAGSPCNTVSPGPRPISVSSGILIHPAVWPWAKNWGAAVPLLGGAGTPSNTMWSRQRPASIPSGILIHPTIWPQYTNVTDRQTTYNRIGRTVLQTVAHPVVPNRFPIRLLC